METVAGARTLTLPSCVSDRAEPLAALARECYPDMVVAVASTKDSWLVRLVPSGELIRACDPGIRSVLAKNYADCSDLMSWHRLDTVGRSIWLESMYHSWALVAWSQWLRSAGDAHPMIIHVARNHDLAAPALLCNEAPASFVGIMEDVVVDLADPPTVRIAVERGMIGIGAYIAPILRALPGDVVHLAPDTLSGVVPFDWGRFGADRNPQGTHGRLTIRDLPDGPCSYRRICNPARLSDVWRPPQPVLLDLDLGYFDLISKRRRGPLGATCSVSELIDGVRPMVGAIAAVTVAYSPGSCPSAQWAKLANELRAELSPLLQARGEREGALRAP